MAAVRDEGNVKAYLDGVLVGDQDGALNDMNMEGVNAELPEGNFPRFGVHCSGAWQYGGLLDDVRIFNHALTLEEIEETQKLSVTRQDRLTTTWGWIKEVI